MNYTINNTAMTALAAVPLLAAFGSCFGGDWYWLPL